MNKKDKIQLQRLCNRLGWEFIIGKTHTKLKHPDGDIISVSGSPSCPYYMSHVMQDVRRLLKKKGQEISILEAK